MRYIQLEFSNISDETKNILFALLGELGYEFEDRETSLLAFTPESNYNLEELEKITQKHALPFEVSLIEEKNWNAIWESEFQPVMIEDFVGIRAHFHNPIKNVTHELIITPKMSFGTGHHATTSLMIRQMRQIDFTGKAVLDFGTGTGILAILAEKLGAKKIIAIDNDDWSIRNAEENIILNNAINIELRKGDCITGIGQYDVILANINRHVILQNLDNMMAHLKKHAIILISGILTDDEEAILQQTKRLRLITRKKTQNGNWICLMLT
jgi:ribosomal protein L11 methyltransferase